MSGGWESIDDSLTLCLSPKLHSHVTLNKHWLSCWVLYGGVDGISWTFRSGLERLPHPVPPRLAPHILPVSGRHPQSKQEPILGYLGSLSACR